MERKLLVLSVDAPEYIVQRGQDNRREHMGYQRKIAYFDLLEDGQKKGNAGFCKWEQRNNQHILAVLLNGLSHKAPEGIEVCVNKEIPVGTLSITGNKGEGVFRLDKSQDWSQKLYCVNILLSEEKELVARFREEKREDGKLQIREQPSAPEPEIEEKPSIPELEIEEKPSIPEPEIEERPFIRESTMEEQPSAETPSTFLAKTSASLWEQLGQSHEKMRPFGTDAEYFRIDVEDIGLLKEEYRFLRNNQFLLHGFYNYHYLILGKKSGEENSYWMGVPGIYHEREKMAARMYGFEKFEGARPGYQTGDLGYYLITAE